MSETIAAIDIETTGLDPIYHDIIEIAIQPLTDKFEPSPFQKPFVARIKARRPENASPKALEINGLDLDEGDDYEHILKKLRAWLIDNGIGKIQILGQNVDFDLSFIKVHFPELARRISHRDIRDSQRLARAFNDIAIARDGVAAFQDTNGH